MCGDAVGDEVINIADVVFLIALIFKSGSSPVSAEAGSSIFSAAKMFLSSFHIFQIGDFGQTSFESVLALESCGEE